MSVITFSALAAIYETKERKAEEQMSRCRKAMHDAQARLEKARARYVRFKEVVERQEESLYRQVMVKIAQKSDFEILKERIHLLKLQLQKRFDHVLECDRLFQDACEALKGAQVRYYQALGKHCKLGEIRDDLKREKRSEVLRKEALEIEDFTPRPKDEFS